MSGVEIILSVIVIGILILVSVRITRQYGRAVVFRFGRLAGMRGPGLFFIIPLADQIVRVDLRVRQLDVPKQTIITRDNISVDVDAIIYYHVTDATRAIVEVEDYEGATALIAQTMLRDVLGQGDLDTILANREALNQKIQAALKLREFKNLSEIAKERNLIVVTNGVDNPGAAMAYAKALNR